MINIQPIEKQQESGGLSLDVHSIFPTIQGEGPFAGRPAVFVRLGGCNLCCPLCDTDYTNGRTEMGIGGIVEEVRAAAGGPYAIRLVVITGGEPFRQNIKPLCIQLVSAGYTVQIETNGTLWIPDFPYSIVHVVCSPKTGKINAKLEPHIHAYKYVVHADQVDENDGLPLRALNHTAIPKLARPRAGFNGPVYVQPVDVQDEMENQRHLQAAIDSVMKYPGRILCLQIHKIINME